MPFYNQLQPRKRDKTTKSHPQQRAQNFTELNILKDFYSELYYIAKGLLALLLLP